MSTDRPWWWLCHVCYPYSFTGACTTGPNQKCEWCRRTSFSLSFFPVSK